MKLPRNYKEYLDSISQYDLTDLFEKTDTGHMVTSMAEQYFGVSAMLTPAIYMLDYTRRKYVYTNDQLSRITGYNNQYLLDGGIEFGTSLWNGNDLKTFSEHIIRDNLQFFQQVPVNEHRNYVLSTNYRIKTKKGESRNLLQRSVFVKSTENGMPLLTVGSLTDITHLTRRFQIFHTIESMAAFTGTSAEPPLLKKWHFPGEADNQLTKRQIEIVKWLCEGLTSEKIGQQLHISVNTINNHRRQILKLTNCSNSVELMRYAFENGYL